MKTIYITEDGRNFVNEKEALEWENNLGPAHDLITKIISENDSLPSDDIAHKIIDHPQISITFIPF